MRLKDMAMTPAITARYATDDERWAAVCRRERDADGVFYYSVRSTGVYCRPSCPARAARRANIAFHDSCAQATWTALRARSA
jgi:AraC family transcriptional regulator of adaptative response/methylated-DNA-[protein]-cysteine methyltransferase